MPCLIVVLGALRIRWIYAPIVRHIREVPISPNDILSPRSCSYNHASLQHGSVAVYLMDVISERFRLIDTSLLCTQYAYSI